jgi:hypothetical protein
MAQVATVTTTGTGQAADWVSCGPGDHVLDCTWAGSAGEATLNSRGPGQTTWVTLEDAAGEVVLTANKSVRVAGNREYSCTVTTHTSALSIVANSCGR